MLVGSLLLRQAYINEWCTEEDYMALGLIQELRGYMSGTQRIEGFNQQEIQEILYCILNKTYILI